MLVDEEDLKVSVVDRFPQMPWQSLWVSQMPQKNTLSGLQGSCPLTLRWCGANRGTRF